MSYVLIRGEPPQGFVPQEVDSLDDWVSFLATKTKL